MPEWIIAILSLDIEVVALWMFFWILGLIGLILLYAHGKDD